VTNKKKLVGHHVFQGKSCIIISKIYIPFLSENPFISLHPAKPDGHYQVPADLQGNTQHQ
jgi:hypothetical protein